MDLRICDMGGGGAADVIRLKKKTKHALYI
jgi:hypothetical protein